MLLKRRMCQMAKETVSGKSSCRLCKADLRENPEKQKKQRDKRNLAKRKRKRKKQEKRRRKRAKVPRTAQQSIPYLRMFQDGICRSDKDFLFKTISFVISIISWHWIEDKTTIFENCMWFPELLRFFNFCTAVVHQSAGGCDRVWENLLIFHHRMMILMKSGENIRGIFEKSAGEGEQRSGEDQVYYPLALKRKIWRSHVKGWNVLRQMCWITLKVLGAQAHSLNGCERLEIMYHISIRIGLNRSGLNTKCFRNRYEDQGLHCTGLPSISPKPNVSDGKDNRFRQLSLRSWHRNWQTGCLQIFWMWRDSINVNIHIQSIDQAEAIKMIKGKISDLDKMKIEEQKRAVRSGYDMDVLPSDLVTYGEGSKNLLEDLQSRNERMFPVVTVLVMSTAKKRQKLDNNIFQVQGIAQKYNCFFRQLDYQQEQGLMSSIPLGLNRIEIQRGLTTSATAIFVPFWHRNCSRMEKPFIMGWMRCPNQHDHGWPEKTRKLGMDQILGSLGLGKISSVQRKER